METFRVHIYITVIVHIFPLFGFFTEVTAGSVEDRVLLALQCVNGMITSFV
jgi:hypothetical protein